MLIDSSRSQRSTRKVIGQPKTATVLLVSLIVGVNDGALFNVGRFLIDAMLRVSSFEASDGVFK